jgi:hypothetical protein
MDLWIREPSPQTISAIGKCRNTGTITKFSSFPVGAASSIMPVLYHYTDETKVYPPTKSHFHSKVPTHVIRLEFHCIPFQQDAKS